jgi:hypothetical protein
MTPADLCRKIRRLPAKPSITTSLERALESRGTRNLARVWYKSQKQHWSCWLKEASGPGGYNRKNPHQSAESIYKRCNNAAMLLWLGEALGLSKPIVRRAKRAVLTSRRSRPSEAAAVRKIIPWQMIEFRLQNSRKKN